MDGHGPGPSAGVLRRMAGRAYAARLACSTSECVTAMVCLSWRLMAEAREAQARQAAEPRRRSLRERVAGVRFGGEVLP